MRRILSSLTPLVRALRDISMATFVAWRRDNASMWAASLAFYSMLSLGPLLFVVVTIGGACLGLSSARAAVLAQVAQTVGPLAADAVASLLDASSRPQVGLASSLLGALSLAFGASGVFAALQDAVNAIWHVAPKPEAGLWWALKRRFASMAMVVGVGFLLTVSCLLSTGLVAVQGALLRLVPLGTLLTLVSDIALSLGLYTLFFAAMYKVLPDARLQWQDVWSGAAVTAGLFSLGKLALAVYLRRAHVESGYGAAGSLALVLIWVYYAAQVFLLGAEWVRVQAQRRGRQVVPSAGAIAVQTVPVSAGPGQKAG